MTDRETRNAVVTLGLVIDALTVVVEKLARLVRLEGHASREHVLLEFEAEAGTLIRGATLDGIPEADQVVIIEKALEQLSDAFEKALANI